MSLRLPAIKINPHFASVFSLCLFSFLIAMICLPRDLLFGWHSIPPFGTLISLFMTGVYFLIYSVKRNTNSSLALSLMLGFFFFNFQLLHTHMEAPAAVAAFLALSIFAVLLIRFVPDLSELIVTYSRVFLVILFICLPIMEMYHDQRIEPFIAEMEKHKASLPMPQPVRETEALPDIYYVIADGYTGNGQLKKVFSYDNAPFTDFLKSQGFYVAEQSRSNYVHTFLSVGSSLNMNYVQEDLPITDLYSRIPFIRHYLDSRLEHILQERGYNIFEATSVNRILAPTTGALRENFGAHNRMFAAVYILNRTPVIQILNLILGPENNPLDFADHHRRHQLAVLDRLDEIIKEEDSAPKFAYVHLYMPHPPFIFEADGSPVPADYKPFYPTNVAENAYDHEYEGGWQDYFKIQYPRQVQFANTLLERIIKSIKAGSKRPVIIIVQGDHGSRCSWHAKEDLHKTDINEIFHIMNAYYFYDGNYSALKPEMTPINSFRIVLNQYLGYDLPLLENKSYFSGSPAFGLFEDVTDQLAAE